MDSVFHTFRIIATLAGENTANGKNANPIFTGSGSTKPDFHVAQYNFCDTPSDNGSMKRSFGKSILD
jgi:hypothetical protein